MVATAASVNPSEAHPRNAVQIAPRVRARQKGVSMPGQYRQ